MRRRQSEKRVEPRHGPNVGFARGRGPPALEFGFHSSIHANYLRVPTMSLLNGALLFGNVMLQRCQPYGLGGRMRASVKPNVYNGSDTNDGNDGNDTNNTQKKFRGVLRGLKCPKSKAGGLVACSLKNWASGVRRRKAESWRRSGRTSVSAEPRLGTERRPRNGPSP
jgi:hypothetical protein